jgi:serine/threonine protein kinase
VDYEETTDQEIHVRSVQIADLEDAVILSPKGAIAGCLSGNQIWRSPEAWARARQDTASDVYSFAIVAIYVMLKQMVFLPGEDAENSANGESWRAILHNHISYFADEDGFNGLLQQIGAKNKYFERLRALAPEVTPRKPFALWQPMNPEFRDLILKMTHLNPKRRITAREALEHPWFRQGRSKGLGGLLAVSFRRMRDCISSKWRS